MSGHVPVMLAEVMAALAPRTGGIYVDATFGAGGYAQALLAAAVGQVWGIERDPDSAARGEAMAREYDGRLHVRHGRFGEMAALLAGDGIGAGAVDGIAFDLGVSSMQIDDPARGFSFRANGPLDMRMDPRSNVPSAADLINTLDETTLSRVIAELGEERRARQVARAVVAARTAKPIRRTVELADIVRRVVRKSADGLDPATRTFQALRVQVNDELGELDRGLVDAERLLRPGGRLCVVAFHSLEDRRVKAFLRDRAGAAPRGSRHRPDPPQAGAPAPTFRLLRRGVVSPSSAEVATNPRARSARLRAAERTANPAWPGPGDEQRRAA